MSTSLTEGKHLIFGAGLIGSYIAGGLISKGLEPNLVGREKTKTAMADGLIISDYGGTQKELPRPLFIDADNYRDTKFDFIWLTVKCTAIANACDLLTPFVQPSTVIICCQNGFGSDQIVRQAYPNNDVLRAIVGFNVSEQKPGHYHRSTEGRLVIECPTTSHSVTEESVRSIGQRLDSEILPTIISSNIEAEQWAKLQLNLSNPVGALSNIPVKEMLNDRGFRKIIARLMTELLNVAIAKDLKLPRISVIPGRWIPHILRLPNGLFNLLGKKMMDIDPSARVSMWWDLHHGKRTEIDFLNGALVQSGKAEGVACAYNEAIVGLVKAMEQTNQRPTLTSIDLMKLLKS